MREVSGDDGKDRDVHVAEVQKPTGRVRLRRQRQMAADDAERGNTAQKVYAVKPHVIAPSWRTQDILLNNEVTEHWPTSS